MYLQEEKAKLPAVQPSTGEGATKQRKPKTGAKVPATKRKASKDTEASDNDDHDNDNEVPRARRAKICRAVDELTKNL